MKDPLYRVASICEFLLAFSAGYCFPEKMDQATFLLLAAIYINVGKR